MIVFSAYKSLALLQLAKILEKKESQVQNETF